MRLHVYFCCVCVLCCCCVVCFEFSACLDYKLRGMCAFVRVNASVDDGQHVCVRVGQLTYVMMDRVLGLQTAWCACECER